MFWVGVNFYRAQKKNREKQKNKVINFRVWGKKEYLEDLTHAPWWHWKNEGFSKSSRRWASPFFFWTLLLITLKQVSLLNNQVGCLHIHQNNGEAMRGHTLSLSLLLALRVCPFYILFTLLLNSLSFLFFSSFVLICQLRWNYCCYFFTYSFFFSFFLPTKSNIQPKWKVGIKM